MTGSSEATGLPAESAHRGILLMLLGMVLFTVNDALGKWLVTGYAVAQLLAVRSLFAMAALTPAILRTGIGTVFRVRRPGLHLFRVCCTAGEIACFYWAVRYLPLANVMTIFMAAPLFVTALSVPLLGERVGWRRWSAVLAGFAGVLLVLKPSGDFPLLPSLVALAGSLVFALGLISTRMLREASGLSLATFQTLGTGLFGAALLPFHWSTPSLTDFFLMGLLGVVALSGHLAINKSLQLSPAATVVPFQYSSIIWATILGAAIWHDIPSLQMAVGASMIVASGLFVFYREHRLARRAGARAAASPPLE